MQYFFDKECSYRDEVPISQTLIEIDTSRFNDDQMKAYQYILAFDK
jgi:hypothetical protein